MYVVSLKISFQEAVVDIKWELVVFLSQPETLIGRGLEQLLDPGWEGRCPDSNFGIRLPDSLSLDFFCPRVSLSSSAEQGRGLDVLLLCSPEFHDSII